MIFTGALVSFISIWTWFSWTGFWSAAWFRRRCLNVANATGFKQALFWFIFWWNFSLLMVYNYKLTPFSKDFWVWRIAGMTGSWKWLFRRRWCASFSIVLQVPGGFRCCLDIPQVKWPIFWLCVFYCISWRCSREGCGQSLVFALRTFMTVGACMTFCSWWWGSRG